MTRLHVSAATGHHQTNTERTIGLAKCALNGIPMSTHFARPTVRSVLA